MIRKKKYQTKVTTKVVFDSFQIVQSGIQIVKSFPIRLTAEEGFGENRKILVRAF
jgi:hypothetical protein